MNKNKKKRQTRIKRIGKKEIQLQIEKKTS